MRFASQSWYFGTLILCGSAVVALGSDSSSDEVQPAKRGAAIGDAVIRSHSALSRRVGDVADYLDQFFVDERVDESYNQSRLRLRLGARGAEGGRSRFNANVSLNLALPRTEQRVSFLLQSVSEDDEDEATDRSDGDRDLVSGLRLYLYNHRRVQVNVDAGFRFRPEPRPRVRLRGQYHAKIGKFLIRPAQHVFWRLVDGVGEITRLDVDRTLGVGRLGRVRTEVEWSEDTPGVVVRPEIILYQVIGDLAGVRLRFGTVLATEPATVVREYGLSVRYRWNFFRPWLFFEIEPGFLLERKRNFEFSPELTFRVETLLGPQYVDELIE